MICNRKTGFCEICSCDVSEIMHKHHIVPRTDPRSTNLASNLAYICPSCHAHVHRGNVIIEGVFQTSIGPKLFWYKFGETHTVRKGVFLNKDGTATIVE